MEQYVIKTVLVSKPDVVFYFRGTANEDGVSFAMNTIVGFDISDAKIFYNKEDAVQLCKKLNEDEGSLLKHGFEAFIIQKTRASHF